MDWLWALVVIFVLFVLLKSSADAKLTNEIGEEFAEKHAGKEYYISSIDWSYLVYDRNKEEIIVGLKKPRGSFPLVQQPYEASYPISSIIKIEIRAGDVTVASANRGSQALGAAIGAAAFGGVGAIIGGLSGSTTSEQRFKLLKLVLTVDDPAMPIHGITFLDASYLKKGLKADSFEVRKAVGEIETYSAIIQAAMQRYSDKYETQTRMQDMDFVNKIRALWELKKEGAISVEEFEMQKSKLLAGENISKGNSLHDN